MRQKLSIGRSAVIIGIVVLLILSFKNYREATRILNSASSLALSEEQNSKLKLASKQVRTNICGIFSCNFTKKSIFEVYYK